MFFQYTTLVNRELLTLVMASYLIIRDHVEAKM